MFKELFTHIDLGRIGEAGMLLFLVTFVAVTIRAMTRSRNEVEQWANLPLGVNGSAGEAMDREESR